MKKLLVPILLLFTVLELYGQYSNKITSKKYTSYVDSLKQMDYNALLPIFGKQAYKAGFDVPFPVGISLNYFMQEQNVIISGLEVGFQTPDNTVGPVNLDSIVVFDQSNSATWAMNLRPDLWVFPFLNVYGIFARGKNSTTVKLLSPVPLEVITDFDASSAGFGILLAGGLGPGWISFDNNWSWSFVSALDDPVNVHNMGIRFGVTKVNIQNPKKNIALWFGAFRQRISSNTVGSISVNELFPDADQGLADRIEQGWEDYLSDKNCTAPVTHPACELDPLVQSIVDKLRTDEPISNTTILYKMEKKLKQEWNMVFGAQYQFNKRVQLRTEYGFLGDRTQFLASLNYRFLL